MELRKKKIIDNAKEREALVFKYSARYGQHPETEEMYSDAIRACVSIDNLQLTITDIARMYGVNPQCLFNQLKRHFPEIVPKREEMRIQLGYVKAGGNRGLRRATVNKYAPAVIMLRDTSLTVKEVAERCGVSYQGLQQHLLFYHKDIADSRMLARVDSMLKPLKTGETTGSGGHHRPRPETVSLYAPALELYRSTKLSVPEIAERCGVSAHNFESYLRKWYKDEMEKRRLWREEKLKEKRELENARQKLTKAQKAGIKYSPAIEYLKAGHTMAEAATALGVNVYNLSHWVKYNYPDVLEMSKFGMMQLPSGKLVSRKKWEKYEPVAEYMCSHPSKSTAFVAEKFGVPVSSMSKHLSAHYPEIWHRHCHACAAKAKGGIQEGEGS